MNTAPSPPALTGPTARRPRYASAAIAAIISLAVGIGALGSIASTATAADADVPKQGKVTVRKDLRADPTGQTVRVDGTGFDPAGVQGTVLLPNRPAGTFVLFGRMPDAWEPSKGIASSVRMAGRDASSQKWAVLAADQAAVTDPTHTGATVLNPDGSFTTTVKVDRFFKNAPTTGNFGIYTYAGDIQNVYAPYETYTPITFIGDTSEVDLPLVEEVAEPSPDTRLATKLSSKVTKKATTKKRGRAVITLKAVTAQATGKVTVTLKAPGRKAVVKKVALTRGKAVVTLPKAKRKGAYTVRARYAGNAKFAATKQSVAKFRVAK